MKARFRHDIPNVPVEIHKSNLGECYFRILIEGLCRRKLHLVILVLVVLYGRNGFPVQDEGYLGTVNPQHSNKHLCISRASKHVSGRCPLNRHCCTWPYRLFRPASNSRNFNCICYTASWLWRACVERRWHVAYGFKSSLRMLSVTLV